MSFEDERTEAAAMNDQARTDGTPHEHTTHGRPLGPPPATVGGRSREDFAGLVRTGPELFVTARSMSGMPTCMRGVAVALSEHHATFEHPHTGQVRVIPIRAIVSIEALPREQHDRPCSGGCGHKGQQ
jgi:hypothetical protein